MHPEELIKAKSEEIALLTAMARRRDMPRQWKQRRADFLAAISVPPPGQDVAVIAEFVRATPERGLIAAGMQAEDVAAELAKAGAAALAVQTEEQFHLGLIGYLERMRRAELPLLRRDFIFHQLQVIETASTPAAAIAFIVRLTPDADRLRVLIQQTEAYGMQAVAEVFDVADLDIARAAGARIIMVNKRPPLTGIELAACPSPALRQDGEVWIATGGIESKQHLRTAATEGYNAVLIGESLMASGSPGQSLADLLKATP